MKVKTSELSGRALDWAVAKANKFSDESLSLLLGACSEDYKPSSDWGICGPLIEEEEIEFKWVSDATLEAHSYLHDPHYSHGLTHQEAACRLIVAAKLGDEVEIPEELMEVK